MALDKNIAQEGADWIAEMVSEDLGGFVPSELIDLIMEFESKVRVESGDAGLDHQTMVTRLVPLLEADGVPMKDGAVTPHLIGEILHWEDEFLAMAGHPRQVRQ
ncbi:MAG: hypothetical protein O3A10_12345 [Chloroflexi bacterium]|nr:hypothetical protein [Chloroflexota bacterium]MDA1146241.1 hypothetical protein [Chloroflexota bacterium]